MTANYGSGARRAKSLKRGPRLIVGCGPRRHGDAQESSPAGRRRWFTVPTAKRSTERDTGTICFVRKSDVTAARGGDGELFRELNPGRPRTAFEHDSDLVSKEPQFIRQHTLVVAAQVDPQTLQQLGRLCWAANLPLVVCRTYGLLGSVRLQTGPRYCGIKIREQALGLATEGTVPGARPHDRRLRLR